jgi:hypothetical protein
VAWETPARAATSIIVGFKPKTPPCPIAALRRIGRKLQH